MNLCPVMKCGSRIGSMTRLAPHWESGPYIAVLTIPTAGFRSCRCYSLDPSPRVKRTYHTDLEGRVDYAKGPR